MKKTILILGLILISYFSYSQYVIADGGNTITYSDRTTLINTMDKQGLDCRFGGGDAIEFVNATGVVQVAYFSQITTPSRTTIYSLIEAVDSMIATYSTFSTLELNVDTINANTDAQITFKDSVDFTRQVEMDSSLTVALDLTVAETTTTDSLSVLEQSTFVGLATFDNVSIDSLNIDSIDADYIYVDKLTDGTYTSESGNFTGVNNFSADSVYADSLSVLSNATITGTLDVTGLATFDNVVIDSLDIDTINANFAVIDSASVAALYGDTARFLSYVGHSDFTIGTSGYDVTYSGDTLKFSDATIANNSGVLHFTVDTTYANGVLKAGGNSILNGLIYQNGTEANDNNSFADSVVVTGNVAATTMSTTADIAVGGDFNPSEWVNVKAYGALGDSATNDAAAIQSALDYAETLDNAVLYFPFGYYKINSGLLYDGGRNLKIVGDNATLVNGNAGTTKMLEIRDLGKLDISGIYFDLGKTNTTVTALHLDSVQYNLTINKCHFNNFGKWNAKGIYMKNINKNVDIGGYNNYAGAVISECFFQNLIDSVDTDFLYEDHERYGIGVYVDVNAEYGNLTKCHFMKISGGFHSVGGANWNVSFNEFQGLCNYSDGANRATSCIYIQDAGGNNGKTIIGNNVINHNFGDMIKILYDQNADRPCLIHNNTAIANSYHFVEVDGASNTKDVRIINNRNDRCYNYLSIADYPYTDNSAFIVLNNALQTFVAHNDWFQSDQYAIITRGGSENTQIINNKYRSITTKWDSLVDAAYQDVNNNLSTVGFDSWYIKNQLSFDNTNGNLFIGQLSGEDITVGGGLQNTFIGQYSGINNTTGDDNTFLGRGAGFTNITGDDNTGIGSNALNKVTLGQNVAIGYRAGEDASSATQNTFIGALAGGNSTTADGCVYLGYGAGFSNNTSNSLFIDNSTTANPLIYGDFANDTVRHNGVTDLVGNLDLTGVFTNGTASLTTGAWTGISSVGGASPISIDVTGTGNSYVEIIQDNNAGFLAIGRTTATEGSMLSITDGNADNKQGMLQLYDDGGSPLYWWTATNHEFRVATSSPADDDSDGYVIIDIDDGTIGATGQNVKANDITCLTISIDSLDIIADCETLADDATITLPDATAGKVEIWVNDGTADELIIARVYNDGSVTLVTTNGATASTDSDTNLCLYDSGTGATIKNRLGSQLKICYEFKTAK